MNEQPTQKTAKTHSITAFLPNKTIFDFISSNPSIKDLLVFPYIFYNIILQMVLQELFYI